MQSRPRKLFLRLKRSIIWRKSAKFKSSRKWHKPPVSMTVTAWRRSLMTTGTTMMWRVMMQRCPR